MFLFGLFTFVCSLKVLNNLHFKLIQYNVTANNASIKNKKNHLSKWFATKTRSCQKYRTLLSFRVKHINLKYLFSLGTKRGTYSISI